MCQQSLSVSLYINFLRLFGTGNDCVPQQHICRKVLIVTKIVGLVFSILLNEEYALHLFPVVFPIRSLICCLWSQSRSK